MRKKKVVLLHNLVYPPRTPLFNLISQNKKFKFNVFFLSLNAGNRQWKLDLNKIKFPYKILPHKVINLKMEDCLYFIFNPTILMDLWREKPDIIIGCGWVHPANYLALIYSKFMKKPFILFSESTVYEKSWRRVFGLPLVKFMVKLADAYLTPGINAKEYLESLGAKKNKVFVVSNAVDNKFFYNKSRLSVQQKLRIKRKFKISGERVILYVGRLERVKGIEYLLDAYKNLEPEVKDAVLVITGDGPLKKRLRQRCKKEKIKRVIFVGNLERSQMPKVYGVADLIVLPSWSEVWGLVINEAMSCGLPVISTENVGSSRDLIKNGINGYLIKARDSQALYQAIKKVLSNSKVRKMGDNSRRIISGFTYKKMADGFIKVINRFCGNG